MNSNQNRENGKAFEDLFIKQSRFSGLLAIKNHLSARYTYNGRLQLIEGDLDFKLIDQDGNVGYFDCKSFDGDSFPYSELKKHQIERACLLNEWGVPAGFIVCFRESRRVIYYSGQTINDKGARTSFHCTEGIFLGFYENFNLRLVMMRVKLIPEPRKRALK